jgi:hypothetical protein
MERELERAGTKDLSYNVAPDLMALYVHVQCSTPIQIALVVAWNGQTVNDPDAVQPGDNSSQPGAIGHACRTMRV